MDNLDGDPSSSSFGHLSINQKYPREYSYSSTGGKASGGYFTIPYGFKATPLSSYDFTIEQRDKIYLKENDKTDLPVVIFFYDEFYLKSDILEKARSMFLEVSNVFSLAIFRFCNLSIETVLAEEFKRIRDDKTHPFNLIISPSSSTKSNLFVLVYKKGYPQCIYEGPSDKNTFINFLSGLSNPEYIIKLKKTPGTIKEQLWIDYNKTAESKSIVIDKDYLEAFSDAPALVESVIVKPAPWPRGRMEHTEANTTLSKFSKTKDKKVEGITGKDSDRWAKILYNYGIKLSEKMFNDRKNKGILSAVNLIPLTRDDEIKDYIFDIITEIFKTPKYNDFYLPPINQNQNKSGGEDAIIKNNSLMVYGIITTLLYLNKYNESFLPSLTYKEEAIKIAVSFYGCYLYKKDERFNTEEVEKLRGLFISEGLNPKYAAPISTYIVENDSLVIKVLKNKLEGNINKFNNEEVENKEDKVNLDEVLEVIKTNIIENINNVFKDGELLETSKANKFPLTKFIQNEDDSYEEADMDDDYEFKGVLEYLNGRVSIDSVRKGLYECVKDPRKNCARQLQQSQQQKK